MDVAIVNSPGPGWPRLNIVGPPALERDTVHELIAWSIECRLYDP